MNAENILTSLNRIAELYAPGVIDTPEYEKLAQSLREEIALAEQKRAGNVDRFKAAVKFAKKCNRDMQEIKPYLAGAYTDCNGKQYIVHSFMAVRYDVPFDGLVEAEEGIRPSVDNMMSTYDRSRSYTLPELGHLKTKFRIDKAEKHLDAHGRSITELDGICFNTEYLIQLIEMVEPEEVYFSNNRKNANLVVFGKGAAGILCPVKRVD